MNPENMNEPTLKALTDSIEHWRRLATGKQSDNEGIGPNDCALCKAFLDFHYGRENCDGCPVAEKVNKRYCQNTPHNAVHEFLFSQKEPFIFYRYRMATPEFRALAQAELDFLVSLLPQENTP